MGSPGERATCTDGRLCPAVTVPFFAKRNCRTVKTAATPACLVRQTGPPWCPIERGGLASPDGRRPSVPAVEGCRLDLPSTDMAEEVVAREDVVDPEALGAGEAFGDVALQEAFVSDVRRPPPVVERALRGGLEARLAGHGRLHPNTSQEKRGATMPGPTRVAPERAVKCAVRRHYTTSRRVRAGPLVPSVARL